MQYLKNRSVWYCQEDVDRGKDVFRFDIRHAFTSYWYRPIDEAMLVSGRRWPPGLSLSSGSPAGGRILQDATGMVKSSVRGRHSWDSAHYDRGVNALALDLSLKHIVNDTAPPAQ